MSLSTDLISQFVKTTKDTDKTKKESTLYGTVKKQTAYKNEDGTTKNIEAEVELDGSAVITPMSSTVDIVEGDRVVVMIKNHKAVVTGNLTNPAARTVVVENVIQTTSIIADNLEAAKASIGELEAETANINKLVAEKASIEELEVEKAKIAELEVETANINTLIAEKASIEELEVEKAKIVKLEADTANINKLVAEKATIKDLDVEKAKIVKLEVDAAEINTLISGHIEANEAKFEQLDATNANISGTLEANSGKIGTLETGVADINTLMFGSATGNVIQSDFANAVIAQLGDAQIKSAMIDSVSANKIAAGEINTNNVKVVSEDGKLTISDETIQISDGTRVRVQIGKDASNDYSINIWDQNGTLMFSEGGITDAAIKKAIIRNDMVSDNANISASKLDIDSLFTKINEDGSNTIKSSKVYLDEEGQTLELAFKEMTTNVTEQGETISSQGTVISTIQGQISSKIWQQDINDAAGEMSTKYSELEQSLDGFKTTVSDTYATKDDVDSDIDDLKDRMTTAETSISQQVDAISLRATKTEVNTAKEAAISAASTDATTKANKALEDANANTSETLKNYSTTAQMNAAIDLKADGITSTVRATYATIDNLNATKEDIDNLTIGGRNLLPGTAFEGDIKRYERLESYGTEGGFHFVPTIQIESGVEYVLSLFMRGNANINFYEINNGGNIAHNWIDRTDLSDTEYRRFQITFAVRDDRTFIDAYICTRWGEDNTLVGDWFEIKPKSLKLERGNRATDWTPAPEDMATTEEVNRAQETADGATTKALNAETIIQQLKDSIKMLVTDENGATLMKQTGDSWTFNTGPINSLINKTSDDLASLTEELGGTKTVVDALNDAVDDLGEIAAYVKIGETNEGDPYIELGEGDSEFKLRITNTGMTFTEGSAVLAYFNNQSLHVEKVVVKQELQQGGFVWMTRSNGNLGLVWKGGN